MATVEDVLSNLENTIGRALTSARETTSRIGWFQPNVQKPNFDYTLNKPNLPAPPTMGDLFTGGDESAEIIAQANARMNELTEQLFPELNRCLKSKPEEWLCSILSGDSEFGLNKTVFEVVWQRARDRQYRSNASELATLSNDLAARGYSLPPGVLVGAQIETAARTSQAMAEVNREQMIQESQIKLDLMKFAEEQAIRLKLGIVDSLRAFYTAWLAVPDKDIERARIRAQAQASLYSSLSSYYNVDLNFEELRLRAENARAGIDLQTTDMRIQAMRDGRNGALGQAVSGYTSVAAAASNAGGALVADITSGGG